MKKIHIYYIIIFSSLLRSLFCTFIQSKSII